MTSKSRPGTGPGVLPQDAFALSVGTLTVLPTPPPTAVNRRVAGWAMILGPLVTFPVTFAAAGIGALLTLAGAPEVAVGFLVVGVLLALTRAIHADGLADTVDGLGASWDRERALDVMRRGDVGPMGAVALIVVIGVQASCLGALLDRPLGWLWAAVLLAASRAALATGTRVGVPAARPEGLGEAVAGTVSWLRWTVCWSLTAAAVVGVAVLTGAALLVAAAAVLTGLFVAEAMLAFVTRRLGGITGDVLGALVETAATAMLLVATFA